jgi:hypothetical protein
MGGLLKNAVSTAETGNEHVTFDFPGQDKCAVFHAER